MFKQIRRSYRIALVLGLTLAVYAPSMRAPFVFDDIYSVLTNPAVTGQRPIVLHASRSLTLFTLRLNHDIGGDNSFGYHVVNLALHLVNVSLLYFLLSHLISPTAALMGAAIFSLHPIQSEAVIYVSGRSELLSTCFGLLAMILWKRQHPIWSGLVLVAAIWSKEGAITVALMLAFGEFLRRRTLWQYVVPVAALGLFAGSLFLPILEHSERPWFDHFMLQTGQFVRYLGLVVFPVGQTIDHDAEALTMAFCVFSGAVLVALGALAWHWRERHPELTMGLAIMAIAVSPRFLINIPEFMAEHHMYLPMVGISLFLASGWEALRWKAEFRFKEPYLNDGSTQIS